MIEAGGLIKLHYHRNYDLLELFDDHDGVLYYNGRSLFDNVEISREAHNYLSKKSDGLFADGTFIDRFFYSDDTHELYFDDIIVSREYTDDQIRNMVSSIWTNNPYHELGKIDLSYWFVPVISTDKVKSYENRSKSDMNIKITNYTYQLLKIQNGNSNYNDNSIFINLILEPNDTLIIKENDNNDLDITVELIQE